MGEKKDHIYTEEEAYLKKAKKILSSKNKSLEELYVEFENLTTQYEELLNNSKLITSISDRFQEKLKLANDKLKEQAENINKINLDLDTKNRELTSSIKKISKSRVHSQVVSFEEFQNAFPDRAACLTFLSEIKWADKYVCKKCGNTKSCDGKSHAAKRCTKCRYDESPTAYTIFHKCKFDMVKAFYIAMLVYVNNGQISSYEISRVVALRQKTCWSFKQKIVEAMKNKSKDLSDSWTSIILQ